MLLSVCLQQFNECGATRSGCRCGLMDNVFALRVRFRLSACDFGAGCLALTKDVFNGDAPGRICGLDVGGSDDSQLYFDSAALVRLSPLKFSSRLSV